MRRIKNKKFLLRNLTLLVCFILTIGLITIHSNNVNAVVASEPTFDIKMNPLTPNPAKVGEDITVSGTITPLPFESDVPKKQVVLVLDVSYSMNENNKIGKLKDAAYNFVEKMRLQQVSNLEVAIVTYASTSTIKTNFLSISNYSSLETIIKNLTYETKSPLYYTNMGEGLRKAEYLLEHGDVNASKSIIFMSDGVPNYYSRLSSTNNNFYMSIDNLDPSYTGDNSGNLSTLAKNYAIQMGNKIRDTKKPNVFSIGYGLGSASSTENSTMQAIHQSMGGSITDGTFFATDTGAIDGVLSKIADNIIASYTITDVKINMNFDSNFALKIGGNIINVNNIKYTLTTSQTPGKVRYEAPTIPYSFTINGNTPNIYNNIFKNSTMTFPWNSVQKSQNMPSGIVGTIITNKLPNITVEKKSIGIEPYQRGKDIDVTYTITPESFNFQSSNVDTSPKDVVILLDVSSAMNGKMDAVKQAINNKILHDDELKTSKSRYSIITYNDTATYYKLNGNDTDVTTKCVSEASYSDLMKEMILYNQAIAVSSSNNRNITNALVLAQNILENGRDSLDKIATSKIDVGRSGGSKNIIIISGGSITDLGSTSLTTQINSIKSKNYNIITLNAGQVIAQNEEPNNNLKDFHYSLMGKQGNSSENISEKENNNYYINVDYRKFDTNNTHSLFLDSNNINSNNTIENPIMVRIASKLKGGVNQSYTFKAKLKFNKGYFDTVSGLNSCSDSGYNVETTEFSVIYKLSNGSYIAAPFDISFKIKPNKTGTLEFGNPGIISYTNLANEITYNPIAPFSITVQSPIQILKYGLYEGIKENSPSIDEGNGTFNILKGTNVTLGATLYGSISNSEDIKLDIVPGQLSTAPIVYTYDSVGNKNRVGILYESSSDSDKRTYKYRSDTDSPISDKNILILFSENISKTLTANQYANTLYAGSDNRNVIINITDELKSPELF